MRIQNAHRPHIQTTAKSFLRPTVRESELIIVALRRTRKRAGADRQDDDSGPRCQKRGRPCIVSCLSYLIMPITANYGNLVLGRGKAYLTQSSGKRGIYYYSRLPVHMIMVSNLPWSSSETSPMITGVDREGPVGIASGTRHAFKCRTSQTPLPSPTLTYALPTFSK